MDQYLFSLNNFYVRALCSRLTSKSIQILHFEQNHHRQFLFPKNEDSSSLESVKKCVLVDRVGVIMNVCVWGLEGASGFGGVFPVLGADV